ncbi:MAG: hypothetical protein J0I99_17010 [Devosia sp.]|uniref:hypothetical protein n=1 Tax=Devosia sp. TaxID=1871048 RepID=UPI001AD33BF9|nr:hypothetical protein [Devosia sp.]MBN9317447.1 hypothetical protein [Devosia sp.]
MSWNLHRFAFLASFGLCGAGFIAAYAEASSYFSSGATPKESFDALVGNEQVRGLSVASSRLVLDNCYDAIVGVYGRLQTATTRDLVASKCLVQADAISNEMPSYSYAWYVGALASWELGDASKLAYHLLQSQLSGPTEQWIAELRVKLVEDNRERLTSDVLQLNDRDLALLVTSYRGVASIAKRYVDDPSFRERITAVVENLPADEQQRFVANVEIAARAGSNPR